MLTSLALLAFGTYPAAAQHEMGAGEGRNVAGVPRSREGSGTAWLPSLSPMYGHHVQVRSWELMFHENVFVQYIDEGGARGDDQLGSINWFMGVARRSLGPGELALRGMISLEPWTVGDCGYPDLLATGELCDGEPLVDRQHPHDFFMELAVAYELSLSETLGLQLYGASVGEPALGPVAYPHRVSSLANPIAPITHHWIDATHITFGVATVGLFGRRWKAEGSVFNGREPDEERFDFDWGTLDSYSGRLSIAPTDNWILQVSGGHLEEAEFPHEPGEPRTDVDRYTASAIRHHELAGGAFMSSTLAWGRNVEDDESTNAFLLESALRFGEVNELYARGEIVEKAAHDLAIEELEGEVFRVGKLSIGYVRDLPLDLGVVPGIGVAGSISFLPDDLEPFYGESTPLGFAVYVRARPAAMSGR